MTHIFGLRKHLVMRVEVTHNNDAFTAHQSRFSQLSASFLKTEHFSHGSVLGREISHDENRLIQI